MSENVVQVPSEMMPTVRERADVWTEYAQARQQVTQFNEMAAKTPAAEPAGDPPNNLSGANTPPAEIVAVTGLLRQHLDEYNRNESSIKTTEGEIVAIKKRVQTIYFAIGATVVVLLLILYFALSG